jgi:ABC exporter DevB family membrane fusion protein
VRRKAALAAVILPLLAAASVVGVTGWTRWREPPTIPVRAGTISQTVVAIGRVEPVTEVILANKIPGRIRAVLVREGDPVGVGQPLILFDDKEYVTQTRMAEARVATADADVRRARRALDSARAQWVEAKSGARPQEIERARAELDQARQRSHNAEAERTRFQRLLRDEYVARSQYEASETEAEVARARVRASVEALNLLLAGPKPETVGAVWARVQEAEAELRRAESQVAQALAELDHARAVARTTVVESTIAGKVTRKLVEPGEAVDIGIPLMILGDVSKTIVKAEVDETDVGKLALGQAADITADAYPGRVFAGTVISIGEGMGKRRIRPDDPVKIQDMRVLETKLELGEAGGELKLGMTVDVRIRVAHKDEVLVIPKALVPPGSATATVQVLGPKGPEARHITLGLRDDARVEVTSGLVPRDRVVVTGTRH